MLIGKTDGNLAALAYYEAHYHESCDLVLLCTDCSEKIRTRKVFNVDGDLLCANCFFRRYQIPKVKGSRCSVCGDMIKTKYNYSVDGEILCAGCIRENYVESTEIHL